MATVVDFECPACHVRCCAHTRRGELVRCPHCFNFVTIPEPKPQVKVGPPPPVARRESRDAADLIARDIRRGSSDPAQAPPVTPPATDILDADFSSDEETRPTAADAPPMIVFLCAHCQTRIETDPANAGLACICPGCHVNLTIPGAAKPIFPPSLRAPETPHLGWARHGLMTKILVALVALGAVIALVVAAQRMAG